MPDEFYGDETLLTSYEILLFFLLVMLAKLMIFNVMKLLLRVQTLLRGKIIRDKWYE